MKIVFTKPTSVQVLDIHGDTFYRAYQTHDEVVVSDIHKMSENYSTVYQSNGEVFLDLTNTSFKIVSL